MNPDELAAIRDHYDNNDQADEIEAAFDAGAVTYHDPRDPETLMLDLTEEWHETELGLIDYQPLHEFLGMTWEQFGRYVECRMPADELAEWAKARRSA
ncbi:MULTISPECIES: hypothetical protein [Nocardia]|uniref:hypothetical protein n=1 Tax=Nocardia TaxID=1817 RepID=UPI000D69C64A|nr:MULTISPECIES: hypothetical protein [Nocardia]